MQPQNKRYCIICRECKHTARRLYYQKRMNHQKVCIGLPIAYCEDCQIYTRLTDSLGNK